MSFEGFSLPEGTFLPPEFSELLPELRTLGEVKVLLVILCEYLRAGLDARPLTFDEIEVLTGLSRGTVNTALQRLRSPLRAIRRLGDVKSYRYEPRLRESLSFRLSSYSHVMHESLHEQKAFPDDMHALVELLNLRCGVARRVAEDIALRYSADVIKRHVSYALFAEASGFVRRTVAAYVVASIRDNWQAPLGFQEKGGAKGGKRWYSEEEESAYFVHPGEMPEEESNE